MTPLYVKLSGIYRHAGKLEVYYEAAALADRYNWPAEAQELRNGNLPDGFGREVGKAIALFMYHGPLCPQTEENRAHGKQLARLRLMIAHIYLAKRERNGD